MINDIDSILSKIDIVNIKYEDLLDIRTAEIKIEEALSKGILSRPDVARQVAIMEEAKS